MFLPHPATSKTAQSMAADNRSAMIFYILYYISFQKMTAKRFAVQENFFRLSVFLCKGIFYDRIYILAYAAKISICFRKMAVCLPPAGGNVGSLRNFNRIFVSVQETHYALSFWSAPMATSEAIESHCKVSLTFSQNKSFQMRIYPFVIIKINFLCFSKETYLLL